MASFLDTLTSFAKNLANITYVKSTDTTGKKGYVGVVGEVSLVNSAGTAIDLDDLEVDITSAVNGGTLVGKPSTATGRDFTTTYATGTTITLSGYPAGVTSFVDEDIEFVRQINTTSGLVTATYTRDDCAMSFGTTHVLTVTGATFDAADVFIVVTNVPRAASASSGVGGGSIVYTNAAGDFTATPTNGAKTVTITGLPFTLEAMHVVAGSIKKIAVTTNTVTNVPLTNCSVSGGVITLSDADNFATGDVLMVTLIGPDKAYDTALDNTLVAVQNPQYAHTTSVETLVAETTWPALTAVADDTGGDATHIIDTANPFTLANIGIAGGNAGIIGYKVYATAGGTYGNVSEFVSVSTIHTTGGTIANWSGLAYRMPEWKCYEINMDTYNFLTIHYRLTCDTTSTVFMKLYGTLDSTATVDSTVNWVDMTTSVFGSSTVTTGPSTTIEAIKVLDTPTTMLKYMVKLIVESTTQAASSNVFTIFIKKSS